jgi:hypothetical protein
VKSTRTHQLPSQENGSILGDGFLQAKLSECNLRRDSRILRTELVSAVATKDLDEATGALPQGDHSATFAKVTSRFGFTPRRRWLLQGLWKAADAFWAAGIEEIFIDGSFCTARPEPEDIDGYWVELDLDV